MAGKQRPFNDAFGKLKTLKQAQERAQEEAARRKRATPAPAPAPPPTAPQVRPDAELWDDATRRVHPVEHGAGSAPPEGS